MTDQNDQPGEVEITFERTPEHFEVRASLGSASIVVRNTDEESDDDLVVLVNGLPNILDAVAEALADDAEEEADRG